MPSDYDKIRNANIREYGEGIRHLSFLGKLYTDRTHFILELLQNAEDAGATKILFHLFNDRLKVYHNGRLFNEKDVKGVCGVGEGTKTESLTQIGKFGIGFKSVYAYTSTPEIHSGEEHFKIENYVRPYGTQNLTTNGFTTLFIFPFNTDGVTSECAVHEIGERLTNLNARTLLFLRSIKEIEYSLPDSTGGFYLRDENPRGIGRQVRVIGQKGSTEVEESWLIFERSVNAPNSQETVRVEVGFNLSVTNLEGKQVERIAKINESPLIVFFPTEKETRFGFLIQGSYRTTPSRDNIPKDDQWNSTLIQETAKLVSEILPEIRNLGLLTVTFLEALPIRTEDFPQEGMFYPIVESVRHTLSEAEILPTVNESYVSAQNALLARGVEFRSLLNSNQLGQLIKNSETSVEWITGEITQDKTPDLHTYLIKQLEVEEFTPDAFARKIESSFLDSQTDEWFITFYKFLSKQEALWRAPLKEGYSFGILRTKPIIRLENGNLECPFKQDAQTPNVFLPPSQNTNFPTVKKSLIVDEQSLSFLKNLGLAEPNLFDDIIENVLPKYLRKDRGNITDTANREDLLKILRALESDSGSESGKTKVIQAAKRTPFIKAINFSGTIIYKRPIDIYLQTEKLQRYFACSNERWFLIDEYTNLDLSGEFWAKLGISSLPRKLPISYGLPDSEREYSTSEEKVNNYDLDGLEQFLQTIQNSDNFEETKKLVFILWDILNNYLKNDTFFFKAKYQWFYYTGRSKNFDSLILTRLKTVEWLPNKNESLAKPSEISTDQLFDEFLDAPELIERLGIAKASDVERKQNAAKELGLKLEEIELIKKNPEGFKRFIASMEAHNKSPDFPIKPVYNPERRSVKILEHIEAAQDREYEIRPRSVRTSQTAIDPKIRLREQYTNQNEQMVCQICKQEMPFHKRDGSYYFEIKAVLSRQYLSKELEAQYLALCPLCAAKYNEFITGDDEAQANLLQRIVDSDDLEIPITLGDETTTIRFVETHFHDVKSIIKREQDESDQITIEIPNIAIGDFSIIP